MNYSVELSYLYAKWMNGKHTTNVSISIAFENRPYYELKILAL